MPLVDRKDRQVPRTAEATVIEHLLKIPQHRHRPVGLHEDPVDKVRPRQRELVPLDRLALVAEERVGLVPECLADVDPHGADPNALPLCAWVRVRS